MRFCMQSPTLAPQTTEPKTLLEPTAAEVVEDMPVSYPDSIEHPPSDEIEYATPFEPHRRRRGREALETDERRSDGDNGNEGVQPPPLHRPRKGNTQYRIVLPERLTRNTLPDILLSNSKFDAGVVLRPQRPFASSITRGGGGEEEESVDDSMALVPWVPRRKVLFPEGDSVIEEESGTLDRAPSECLENADGALPFLTPPAASSLLESEGNGRMAGMEEDGFEGAGEDRESPMDAMEIE
jgi:hypothetical protein